MKQYSLKAELRQGSGKRFNKDLRKKALIPGVVYGGTENINVTFSQNDVRGMIYTPDIFLINLDIEGTAKTCIIQELQFHPVTDEILHIDLLEVFKEKPIIIEVPVQLDGHAIGVRAGGKLNLDIRKLKVKGFYENVPERLHIDVTKLGLGKTIKVGELTFENLQLLNAKNAVVAAVRTTRAARSAGAMAVLEEEEETEE